MKTLITIDPGKSSGVTIGTYSDTEPYKRTHAFQIEGGLMGFKDNFRFFYRSFTQRLTVGQGRNIALQMSRSPDLFTVVCEKFIPRQALTLDAAEPLRIEGYLVGTGVLPDYIPGKKNPQWQPPSAQYFTGGEGLADKKKRARLWRLEHGLHLTGKDVGCPDADDANSATMHAIAYMRKWHKPTQQAYFGGET